MIKLKGKITVLFLVTFLLSSCNMNESKETIKILFLGNSITHHSPSPTIGWYGDWGMAASSIDNDYVHQLIKKIKEKYPNKNIEFKEQNIATWERDFTTDMTQYIEIENYRPDILIIRLGENVSEQYAKDNNYSLALSNLINNYKTNTSSIIITGNFLISEYKDQIQKEVAVNNNYYYVDLTELSGDTSNKAIGKYDNSGVAAHPSDKGMLNISNKIFECIKLNSIIN